MKLGRRNFKKIIRIPCVSDQCYSAHLKGISSPSSFCTMIYNQQPHEGGLPPSPQVPFCQGPPQQQEMTRNCSHRPISVHLCKVINIC